ncbi:MAG: hypothetical protein ACWA5A_09315 [Marinibacterium sp.]
MLKIKDNIAEFERGLSDIARRQVPFAVALALNDTAADVERAWRAHLQERLDRPTPFTLRGMFKARASKRTLTAVVGFKRIQSEYLRLQAEGGTRFPMGRALVLPVGQKLNRYGNIPRGAVRRSLARDDTFVASGGKSETQHLAPGVYRRPKRGSYRRGRSKPPQLLISFKGSARYGRTLDLQSVAMSRALASFPDHFRRRFIEAMNTAR